MRFETFFRTISYATVFCGFLALWVSGTFGIFGTTLFVGILIAAWFLEDSRWQISERVGTALIVLALPAYYLAFKFQLISFVGTETIIAGILGRMILSLSAIKLLQKKGDRDWVFLYLMSFFEVLLAAGLSISALYLATFLVYLFVMVCSIVAYEIRKAAREVVTRVEGHAKPNDAGKMTSGLNLRIRRLPTASVVLIGFILLIAAPLFFMLPRVGGAGLGGSQRGLATSTGFSDNVRLGGIGNIQQSDEIVMRVRSDGETESLGQQYFRGVALDRFDNRSWSKTRNAKEPFVKGESELIQVDNPSGREKLFSHTIYLEPLDTPVLFSIPKAVAFRGNFPVLYRDAYGAVNFAWNSERSSYTVFSDRSQPPVERLREDNIAYGDGIRNYLQLPPDEDKRIFDLTYKVVENAGNRYDKAKAVELYLESNFGYTLDQKASGDQPLSDFLFNVREGHCEYFATAMAVMLRTQGIATRIVNGFHGGDYNDAVDMTVIRQRHAHSWVEVYFPKENTWVTFDPTPSVSDVGNASANGFGGAFTKYLEAIDTIWIQYFVAFDNQEQHTMARSLKDRLSQFQGNIASYLGHIQDVVVAEWWSELNGDKGTQARILAALYAVGGLLSLFVGLFLIRLLYRKVRSLSIWKLIRGRGHSIPNNSIVEFYARMSELLAEKGYKRPMSQTPLEFAYAINLRQAVQITERYNGVRFGAKDVSADEAVKIDEWLSELNELENTSQSK